MRKREGNKNKPIHCTRFSEGLLGPDSRAGEGSDLVVLPQTTTTIQIWRVPGPSPGFLHSRLLTIGLFSN